MARLSAIDIADHVGIHRPTAEQQQVIEFAEERPALVIAGAGSGKTETMARRVVWLVANGLVSPEQVLGLTFTRKAATELGARINRSLDALEDAGLTTRTPLEARPTVSTYNAFANTLFQDNALRIGYEPDATLLTEAGAWELAHQVVLDADADEALYLLGRGPAQVAALVLRLAHAMVDNAADPDELLTFADGFRGLAALRPARRPAQAEPVKGVLDLVDRVASLEVLVPLAVEYGRRKRELGLIEYADQVALAARALSRDPAAIAPYRQRHRAVFLDEYQDTSVSQTRLLSRLFAGLRVMAVGDPNQAIYGWRGASSGNLAGFPADFGDVAAPRFQLATSWRNSERILAAANALVAAPAAAAPTAGVLRLRARCGADEGAVDTIIAADAEQEAAEVATWLESRLTPESTAAVLFRVRATMPAFARALAERGIPHEIVGFAGVLDSAEVVDLLCALHVVADAEADNELVRLLSGTRWRIGPADLAALGRFAAEVASYGDDGARLDPEVARSMRQSVAGDEHASLVDALDLLHQPSRPIARLIDRVGFTEVALQRLERASRLFAGLRRDAHLPIVEFVRLVIERIGLDIELQANESLAHPLRNLHALMAKVSDYDRTVSAATLPGLLAWLERVGEQENLSLESAPARPGVVQLLTVHAAKGLEWDHVVVPRMVLGELPTKPRSTRGWVTVGELPYEFRGDSADLPEFDWREATDSTDLTRRFKAFAELERQRHLAEERRIAYVALTRGRHDLLLSASPYRDATSRAAELSPFLVALAAAEAIPDLADVYAQMPAPDEAVTQWYDWPNDPLGARRPRVEAAAQHVRAAAGRLLTDAEPAELGVWRPRIEGLLREREEQAQTLLLPLPERVAASRFKDFVLQPEQAAAAIYRPMPSHPYAQTRVGTLFHEWVEQRYRNADQTLPLAADRLAEFGRDSGLAATADDADELAPVTPVVLDAESGRMLQRLCETFERSRWGARRPVAVETQIRLPLSGAQVVCKLDAVFATDDGYEVVDWKTGRPPADDEQLRARQLQLALYRLAWAAHTGVDVERVSARFYYVADDVEIAPEHWLDAEHLARQWRSLYSRS